MAAGALRRGGPELCGQLLELAPAARPTGDWQDGWPDLLGWFRGFARTATPAKLGELSRVQLLHEQLGYPCLPLVHVFVAERCADVVAVALLLLVRLLAPAAITLPASLAIYLLSGTAGMASSLPGGIGVNEGTTVLLLVQQGVPMAIALPIAVLRRLIRLWSVVALAAAVGIRSQPIGIGTECRRDSR
jgi:uncharacterized membrane protein YbhN (UPF0104 family)